MCHLTGKSEPVAPSEDECKAVVGEAAPVLNWKAT